MANSTDTIVAPRRTLLRGLAALPLATLPAAVAMVPSPSLAAAPALAAEVDPIVSLHRRFFVLQAEAEAWIEICTPEGDEIWDRTLDAADELVRQSLDNPPTTLAGAATAIAWARWEYARPFTETDAKPDPTERWVLAMLDGALGVLLGASTA